MIFTGRACGGPPGRRGQGTTPPGKPRPGVYSRSRSRSPNPMRWTKLSRTRSEKAMT